MRFLLIVQICSVITQQCTDPVEFYPTYNTHYDCATAGFIKGMSFLREVGPEDVNSQKLIVNFSCKALESI